jgi:hypothetical protein
MAAAPIISDIAFTPRVKAIQSRKGSRETYARMERNHGWSSEITLDLAEFIAAQRSVYLATSNAEGQPYIQHRGGPPGFLRVIDSRTLGFVDFKGNRQYISQGNLAENAKAFLFLKDYANRRRVKIWGTARIVEGDDTLIAKLMPTNYHARAEQVILFVVTARDANCPQHIPQRFEAEDVARALAARDARIRELQQELARVTSLGGAPPVAL